MSEQLPRDQIFISKLTEITLANLGNESFDAKELANQSGMSHYSLSRKLYALTNKTITQFIRETRLHRALELLQAGELTAAEIAYKAGFSSPAYFNTCFHEYFGYPPGKFKKSDLNFNGEINNTQQKRVKAKNLSLRRILILLSAIVFPAVLLYLGFNTQIINHTDNAFSSLKRHEKSIAVLPFKNLSSSNEDQYFIEGLTAEILTNLCRIHDLRVISQTSVEQFRVSTSPASEIAKKLHVHYIVEGSGQKYGNAYRLRVQLIEASTDRHIWAESYEQNIMETKDIFTIQSQIAQKIAFELKANITPEEKRLIEKIPTADLTAYDFYQRGTEELRRYRSDNRYTQSLSRAEELYKLALQYDSAFALAYIGLGDIYWTKYVFESYYSKNYLDSVKILADRALLFDNQLAEAYNAGANYYIQTGMTEKAIQEYDKALAYKPNYWEAYYGLGYKVYIMDYQNMDFVKGLEYIHKAVGINHSSDLPFLLRELGDSYGTFAGFSEKADYYYREALKLDGDTARYLWRLADVQGASGNYKKAEELYNTAYSKDTNLLGIIAGLASCYELHGQYYEALKYVKKFEKRLEENPALEYSFRRMIGYTYLKNGYKNRAEEFFKEQRRISEESIKMGRVYSIDANFDLAALCALKGDREKAYENLRMVDKIHACPFWLVNLLKNDPFFSSIKNEPEFQQIIRDMEAKYNAEHERVRKWLEEQGNQHYN